MERRYNHPVKMALDQIDEMLNLKRKSPDAEGHLRLVMDTFERVTANVKNILIAEQFPDAKTEDMAALEDTAEMQSAFMNVVWGRTLSRNFDAATEEAFKIHQSCNGIDNRSIPTLKSIQEFVYRRIATVVNKRSEKQPAYVYQQANVNVQQHSKENCMLCRKNGHIITRCRNFINMKIEDRIKAARELKLCFKCAVSIWKNCRCAENKSLPYHKLLQYPKATYAPKSTNAPRTTYAQKPTHAPSTSRNDDQKQSAPQQIANREAKINVVNEDKIAEKITLLPTALVRVKAKEGKWIVLRALVDQGATHSIITTKAQHC